jgi:hypothetical protein
MVERAESEKDRIGPVSNSANPLDRPEVMNDSHRPSESSNKAWVTLLTNEGYLRGVLALSYSLRKSDTAYPFYVIYTDVSF